MNGLHITVDMLDSFLDSLNDKKPDTINACRRMLEQFFLALPEDKLVFQDTLAQIVEDKEEEGYSSQAINTFLSVVNGFLSYYQRNDLQCTEVQQELTRAEYLRLLAAAKKMGYARSYLLIKVFAVMGITVAEVERVTVETVDRGFMMRGSKMISVPRCLQEELKAYCEKSGIQSGSVFINNKGTPCSRTSIYVGIKRLARAARVDKVKCNPRCLRKLYQSTQEQILNGLQLMAKREYEQLLEQEQAQIGREDEK